MPRRIPTFAGLCLAVVLAGPCLAAGAAKPTSGGTTASIALDTSGLNSSSATSSTFPSLGQTVNFITAVPGGVKSPMVEVDCYQSTTLVWAAIQPNGTQFQLGASSSPWVQVGGSADCQAFLEYFTWKGMTETGKVVLASTGFSASA